MATSGTMVAAGCSERRSMESSGRSGCITFVLMLLLAFILGFALVLSGCENSAGTMVDGYYTAEMAEFDEHGWKENITIYVKDNKIISVDYEAKNESGFIKSWDMDYMRNMNAIDGTYPNKYVRQYSEALLSYQDPAKVQAVTGATHSFYTFRAISIAALNQARAGNTDVAYVAAE